MTGNNPTFGPGSLEPDAGESTDQFGAKTGREKAYPLNIGAGQAGTAGATGDAPADGSGAGKASGGEEVVAGKSGIAGEQAG